MKAKAPPVTDREAWVEYLKRFTIREAAPYGLPDPCWLWTRSRTTGGYGNVGYDGRVQKVHRLSFMAFTGEIPDGLLVCHKCDRRACCNPAHLFLGTHQDNSDDCSQKQRIRTGEGRAVGVENARSKLTDESVTLIRSMGLAGKSEREIAREFRVSHTSIGDILRGKTWRHVQEVQAA